MKLLINTHCAVECDYCGYAFLDLTPELAAKILKRRDALKAVFSGDSSAASIEYYDSEMVYLSGVPDEAAELLNNGEPFAEITAAAEDFEDGWEQTGCNCMVITSDEVYWSCYPHHLDNVVETRPIDYRTVAACV